MAAVENLVKMTAEDFAHQVACLHDLQNAFRIQFGETNLSNDERSAIRAEEEQRKLDDFNGTKSINNRYGALNQSNDSTPAHHSAETEVLQRIAQLPLSERSLFLAERGRQLIEKSEHTCSGYDLAQGIQLEEEAIALTAVDHPYRLDIMINLGLGLQKRFMRTGSMNDLDRSIELTETALPLIPAGDPSSRIIALHNLGLSLEKRSERTGSSIDLARSIESSEQAVNLVPFGHPNRPACLDNLGCALHRRFERAGTTEDLNRSIELMEEGIAATPSRHPFRPKCLNNLGSALTRRFQYMGSMADLTRAIVVGHRGNGPGL